MGSSTQNWLEPNQGVSDAWQGDWGKIQYVHGLPDNTVTAITQDADGLLWVGTKRGLCRYDGRKWQKVAIPHDLPDSVNTVLHDGDGTLWVGTTGGLKRYDGKAWRDFSLAGDRVSERINTIYQDRDGVVWIGTSHRLIRFDVAKSTVFAEVGGDRIHSVNAIYQDDDGLLWVGTGKFLGQYDGNAWRRFNMSDGLADNGVNTICQDAEGALWIGTNTGIDRYDGRDLENFSTSGTRVKYMRSDGNGRLWIAFGHSLFLYNTSERAKEAGYRFPLYGELTGEITALYVDREGIVWVGAHDMGLAYYTGECESSFRGGVGKGRDGTLWLACAESQEHLWRGFPSNEDNNTIKRHDGAGWETVSRLPDGMSFFMTRYLISGSLDGSVWLDATNVDSIGAGEPLLSNICHYNGKEWYMLSEDDIGTRLPPLSVTCIYPDEDDVIWIGTHHGLKMYDGERWNDITIEYGLVGNAITAIHRDRHGLLWVGTSQGLSYHDGAAWVTIMNGNVTSIYRDGDDFLWVGTPEGLRRYNSDSDTWDTFTEDDDLSHNHVHSICQSSDGILWIATDQGGVSLYDGRTFQSLNKLDGLAGNRITSMAEDSNGDLWFRAPAGLTRFHRTGVPPLLAIKRVVADGNEIQDCSEPSISIPKGQAVTFEYQGISLKPNPKLKYFCKLAGYDSDWRHPVSEERMKYPNLPRGQYEFQVQAVDRNLNYSEIKSVSINIIDEA